MTSERAPGYSRPDRAARCGGNRPKPQRGTTMGIRETDPLLTNTPTRNSTDTAIRTDTGTRGSVWQRGETKGSWKTTEFWAAIAGVVALIVTYNAADDLSLDLFRACLLCTLLGAAYIVSRGLAKSGSRPERFDWRDR